MYNKKNDTLTGTIEETRMKLSTEGPFPIFEIYHNNIKSMINIVCFSDKKTSFMIDDPFSPKDSKENVSSDNTAYYYNRACIQINQ